MVENLIKDIETLEDKLEIFRDSEWTKKYNITIGEFLNVINRVLDDEQKKELLKIDYIKKLGNIPIFQIIKSISDSKIKFNLINNKEIIKGLSTIDLYNIIVEMDDSYKTHIISDKKLYEEQFKIPKEYIVAIIKEIKDSNLKIELMQKHELEFYNICGILKTCNDTDKVKVLRENKYNFRKWDIADILETVDEELLIELLNNKSELLDEYKLDSNAIISRFSDNKKLNLILRIEDINITDEEKTSLIIFTFRIFYNRRIY